MEGSLGNAKCVWLDALGVVLGLVTPVVMAPLLCSELTYISIIDCHHFHLFPEPLSFPLN